MKEAEQIPLAPISGWEIGPISAYGAVMMKIHYLTNATQRPKESQHSPNFVMQAAQCRELIQTLEGTLKRLESGPPPGTGLPKH